MRASLLRRVALLVALACAGGSPALHAQAPEARADTVPPAGACWRVAFGTWDPPLDWTRAGHPGAADTLAERVRRVRDSVFDKDAAAVGSNAMLWHWSPRGWTLLLFPPWWPVGVEVRFGQIRAADVEISGEAVALVGNASQSPSRAKARASRCP